MTKEMQTKRYAPWLAAASLTLLCLVLAAAGCKKSRPVVQTGHSSVVTSVAFSADGKTLASASWDDTVKLWDVWTSTELRTLQGHSDWIHSVAFSPNGKTLASGSGD